MSKIVQIGWLNLKADKVFRNTFECAGWYEDILVDAGKYPVFVYDYHVCKSSKSMLFNRIEGHISGAYIHMDGTIVEDDFSIQYGKVISNYDRKRHAGRIATYHMMTYMHSIADSILNDPDSSWELFPEFEAKAIDVECDGVSLTTYGIFKASKRKKDVA